MATSAHAAVRAVMQVRDAAGVPLTRVERDLGRNVWLEVEAGMEDSPRGKARSTENRRGTTPRGNLEVSTAQL